MFNIVQYCQYKKDIEFYIFNQGRIKTLGNKEKNRLVFNLNLCLRKPLEKYFYPLSNLTFRLRPHKSTNTFPRLTDIIQVSNELPTDKRHINVPQYRLPCPTRMRATSCHYDFVPGDFVPLYWRLRATNIFIEENINDSF